jgi:hypothetical protein
MLIIALRCIIVILSFIGLMFSINLIFENKNKLKILAILISAISIIGLQSTKNVFYYIQISHYYHHEDYTNMKKCIHKALNTSSIPPLFNTEKAMYYDELIDIAQIEKNGRDLIKYYELNLRFLDVSKNKYACNELFLLYLYNEDFDKAMNLVKSKYKSGIYPFNIVIFYAIQGNYNAALVELYNIEHYDFEYQKIFKKVLEAAAQGKFIDVDIYKRLNGIDKAYSSINNFKEFYKKEIEENKLKYHLI